MSFLQTIPYMVLKVLFICQSLSLVHLLLVLHHPHSLYLCERRLISVRTSPTFRTTSEDRAADEVLYHSSHQYLSPNSTCVIPSSSLLLSSTNENKSESDNVKSNFLSSSQTLSLSSSVFGADSFGDIMGNGDVDNSILTSKQSSSLLQESIGFNFISTHSTSSSPAFKSPASSSSTAPPATTTVVSFQDFSPMERIVLTSNGNLQRIMSAHYGATVVVKVIKCEKVSATHFDREVDLLVNGKKFCTAKGQIEVHSEECLRAIESKQVGVGQLFRYFRALPSFTLLHAVRIKIPLADQQQQSIEMSNSIIPTGINQKQFDDKNDIDKINSTTDSLSSGSTDSLQRHYLLTCPQVSCEFIETFVPNFLDDDFLTS